MIFEDILGPSKPKSTNSDEIWERFERICDMGGVDDVEREELKKLLKIFDSDPSTLDMTEEEMEAVRDFLIEGLDNYIDDLKEGDK